MAQVVLHDFIVANRDEIIARVRRRVRERATPKLTEANLQHGVPLFLTQLAAASAPSSRDETHRAGMPGFGKKISDSAAIHGQDLLSSGFTVAQVVHCYGDVCQVVTELACETNAAISSESFQLFNGYLDDAIAGAVTAYGQQRERDLAYAGTERLGVLAHELRNLLNTAVLSFDVIKKGTVGLGGSTGAIHARSLTGLSALVERSLAEVRLQAGVPTTERLSLLELIEEVEISGSLQAEGYGLHLTVRAPEADVVIKVDRQLLMSAISNLLQNAFKFTRPHGKVTLGTRTTVDRIQIEVADECGGLPKGQADDLFLPFARRSGDCSGLGLGLTIARSAVQANAGDLSVRDIPGMGCVFTIDLPRLSTTA